MAKKPRPLRELVIPVIEAKRKISPRELEYLEFLMAELDEFKYEIICLLERNSGVPITHLAIVMFGLAVGVTYKEFKSEEEWRAYWVKAINDAVPPVMPIL